MRLSWLLIVSFVGCADGTSAVTLTVDATAEIPGVDHLRVSIVEPASGRRVDPFDVRLDPGVTSVPPRRTFGLVFDPDVRATLEVEVRAVGASGVDLANGRQSVSVAPGQAEALTIMLQGEARPDLGGSDGPVDMTVPPIPDLAGADLGPVTCFNAAKDPDEVDVDCGGVCAKRCAANQACGAAQDCASNDCFMNQCRQASGPPNWLKVGDLVGVQRIAHATAFGPDGRIHMMGGCAIDETNCTNYQNNEAFVPTDGSSALNLPLLPTARGKLGAATGPDGRIYTFGGFITTTPSNAVEAFDTTTVPKMWQTGLLATPAIRWYATVVTGATGLIYVIGGAQTQQPYYSNKVEAYNTSTNMWTQGLATISTGYRSLAAGALGPDNRIYLFGGLQLGAPLAEALAYIPTSDSWATNLPAMSVPRYALGAATGADGRVYAIGGENGTSFFATVEAYSHVTNRWTSMPSLVYPGGFVAAVTGPDGRIYAVGGRTGKTDPNTQLRRVVEAYGPRVTLSADTGPAASARSVNGSNFAANATVTLLFGSTAVGSGATNVAGALVAPIQFTVPAVAPGKYKVTAVDNRSEYPVYSTFTVQ
jgi:hypothetical protein